MSARRRVVVTGMGGICALGATWQSVRDGLRSGRSGITTMPEWASIEGLRTRLGAPVTDPDGKSAPRTAENPASDRARTLDVICHWRG